MREYLSDKMWQARGMLLLAKERMKEQALRLVKDEDGDTNFVAIIVIIVILIAIAAVFHDALEGAINGVFESLNNFVTENEGGKL